jgi:thiol-disulfide isomerase/thioredoxin
MKKILFTCVLSMLSMIFADVNAQETNEGVVFVENKTFAEAVAMAKESGKKVFLDCYTSWCGPCKMMTKNIFPQKAAGDYFNSEFVNIKIDMEKGEGPDLAKRLKVRAYPTFVMFDSDGKEIGRLVGGMKTAEEFVEAVKNAVGESSLSAMNERYDKGERSSEFMSKYLTVLSAAYESDKAKIVAEEMLSGKGQELLDNPALFSVFVQYCSDPLSTPFQYVLQHKDEFNAKYPKANLNRVLDSKWMSYPHTLIKRNSDGTATFDEASMEAFVKEMEKWDVKSRKEIVLLSDINVAEATKDWKNYAKYCTKYIKRYGENDMNIYNWALRIQQKCQDAKVRKTAVGWMQKRIDNLKKAEAKMPPLKEGEIRAIPLNNFAKSYEKLIEQLKN